MAETKVETAKSDEDNMMAAVAYIMTILTGIIVYILYKDKGNRFVLFHAVQAILVGCVLLAAGFVCSVFAILLIFVPVVGWCIQLIMWLGYVAALIAAVVFLAYQAYQGRKFKVPVLGDFAEKHAG